MSALSYVASDYFVQIAFLALIAFIIGAALVANGNRRREELEFKKQKFTHAAAMEVRQFDREISAFDGKALPAPKNRDLGGM